LEETGFIVILVTASSFKEAGKISTSLVKKKFAACCNIVRGVTSIYEWKGKVEKSEESLLIIKTRQELFEEVKEDILKNHSCDLPEIISLPITDGLEGYLNWIGDRTES